MDLFNTFNPDTATVVGYGASVFLVSSERTAEALARKFAGLGCRVERCHELYHGLERIFDGPQDFDLLVINADDLGGLAVARRAHAMLRATGRFLPVMLVSQEFQDQIFPQDRLQPVELRSPASALALRVGFEHTMQDRLLMRRAG